MPLGALEALIQANQRQTINNLADSEGIRTLASRETGA